MAGMFLESGVVLVPLAFAALYVIVSSNQLLFVFGLLALFVGLAAMRLRYHYSTGAQVDLVVRVAEDTENSTPHVTREDGFRQIVEDARRIKGIENETVEGSGALLSTGVTTENTKFDMELYGSGLRFDHRCFYIEQQPSWVVAANFDYWRIPIPQQQQQKQQQNNNDSDLSASLIKDTWKFMLRQYKAAGFNTIRVRFHWGFHSPSKGKYDFSGVRDVSLLLSLCEELGLLVIACIGPYIGDDVQGGGFPFWLIQRDHIRLRHLWKSGIKWWDNRFAAAESEWYDHIIPMLVGHEIVTKNVRGRGCVLMVQLENGLSDRGMFGLPLALQDETRLLGRMARERLIRAPLVTNNLQWPHDFTSKAARIWSYVESKLRTYRVISASPYRTDISAFSLKANGQQLPLNIDTVAQITKGDNTPMMAMELYSFDVETMLSQGLSAFALPSFFAAQGKGNFDSPAITCPRNLRHRAFCKSAVSADDKFSEEARTARLVINTARALTAQLAASDNTKARPWLTQASVPTVRGINVDTAHTSIDGAISVRRQWERNTESVPEDQQRGMLAFIDGRKFKANFREGEELALLFTLVGAPVAAHGDSSFALTYTLGSRNRGIFAANICIGGPSRHPLVMVASTKEIYSRIELEDGNEVWLCAEEEVQSGQMFFHGECIVSGHAEVETVDDVEHVKDQKFSFIIPKSGSGVIKVEGNRQQAAVYVVLLNQQALDTLTVGYPHYSSTNSMARTAAWGDDGLLVDADGNLSCQSTKQEIVVISSKQPSIESFNLTSTNTGNSVDFPFIWQYHQKAAETASEAKISVSNLERRITNWDNFPWKLLPTMADLETMDEINVMSWQRDLGAFAFQATDVGYVGSHVLYRCQVRLKPQHIRKRTISLELNMRHRCTVWVNGTNISGHETFADPNTDTVSKLVKAAMRTPGCARGPDKWSGGTVTYDVTKLMNVSASSDKDEEGAFNEVIVVVESYGLGTQSHGANDARTPRGLIAAYWHGFNLIGEDHDDSEIHDHANDSRKEQMKTRWEICGVDVTQLEDAYNSSGFPDENSTERWSGAIEKHQADAIVADDGWATQLSVNVNAGIQWWRWELQDGGDGEFSPIHLNINGRAIVYVWVDGVLVGKHRKRTGSNGSSVVFRTKGKGESQTMMLMAYGWADDTDTKVSATSTLKHRDGNSPTIDLDVSLHK